MLEPGRDLDLPMEPVFSHPPRALGAQHFDGDPAAVLGVVGDEDPRHASGADLALQDVAISQRGLQPCQGIRQRNRPNRDVPT